MTEKKSRIGTLGRGKNRDKIQVLIADDSYLWAATIAEVLDGDRDIHIALRVTNGQEAINAVERLRPDLVMMDIHMPVLGGLDAISVIMAHYPTPILVMTGDAAGGNGELTFEALRRGALDLMVKDTGYPPELAFVHELRAKVKALAAVQVVRHVAHRGRPTPRLPAIDLRQEIRTVGIVASTGGPSALSAVLKDLPRDFGAGIVIVQHLTSEFAPIFASWLDGTCRLPVALAQEGESLETGRVLIAPADCHLMMQDDNTVHLRDGLEQEKHRPSGNVLLASLATSYASTGLGLVMTGMGSDGAQGLLEMRQAGALTFAQDEASSAVFGMPQAAGALGAVRQFVPLEEIAEVLENAVRRS